MNDGMKTNIRKNKAVVRQQQSRETSMNCTQVEKVNSMKYLETTFSNCGNSSCDIHIRIFNGGCGNENNCISFAAKYTPHKYLVVQMD